MSGSGKVDYDRPSVKDRRKQFDTKPSSPREPKPTVRPKPTERKPANIDSPREPKPTVRPKPTERKPANIDSPREPKPTVRPKPTERKPANIDMVSDSDLFTNAMQLIYTDTDGQLQCNQETIVELHKIDKPLNVVAVTGRYRTGKSFLLNRLYGQSQGKRFKVGHTTTAETKGIWIQCKPHPTQEGQVLMLMDAEGLGDIKKVNSQEDTWLFVLVTLLSSTLVYNIKGGFDSDAIKKLKFLRDFESSIKVSGEDNNHMLIDFYCPVFVLALRDFHLQLDEATPTPDAYLEYCLDKYNSLRLRVRKFFKKRKCFTFGQPCDLKKAEKLNEAPDSDLDPDFVKSLQSFSEYVFGCSPVMLKTGKKVNGRMLGSLTLHYVNSIRDGKTPSILEASKSMAETENDFVVNAAGNLYKIEMQKRIADINPENDTLGNFHKDCMKIAIQFLKDAIVFDDQEVFKKQALDKFKKLFITFKNICDKSSEAKCRDVFGRLNLRIQRKMKNQAYKHPSGYDEYMTDINTLVKKFEATAGLGAKSRSVLQEFIDGKTDEEEAVFQMVVEAQGRNRSTADGSKTERPKREMQNAITKSKSFREQLISDIKEMENHLETEIEETQNVGINNIRSNIEENVQLKLKEIERQLAETVKRDENKEAIESLENERIYLEHMLKQSKQKREDNRDDENVYDIPWDKFPLDPRLQLPLNPNSDIELEPKPKPCNIL